ncbi:MAG TPA: GNAT family N-acetyltransferase [Polyangiaceae bacterium]|nr:GNAT family N-acetyltransferase [Polyangiaceae bacterium]
MSIEIREANLAEIADAEALLHVLDSYARDAMGGAAALPEEVRQRLIPALREQPQALVLLAFRDARVVGLANCFFGFSTFAARPLLNVHDLAVLPTHRGQGIGRALLQAAEEHARRRGCVKLTLEVREDNERARGLYHDQGFRDFVLPGGSHRTLFLSKSLA